MNDASTTNMTVFLPTVMVVSRSQFLRNNRDVHSVGRIIKSVYLTRDNQASHAIGVRRKGYHVLPLLRTQADHPDRRLQIIE